MQEHESPLVDVRFLRAREEKVREEKASIQRGQDKEDKSLDEVTKERLGWGEGFHHYLVSCRHCKQTKPCYNPHQSYCSPGCYQAARAEQRVANVVSGPCPVCHLQSKLACGTHEIKVCSRKCAATLAARINRKKSDQRHPAKPLGERKCQQCDTAFVAIRVDHKFCSLPCWDKWRYWHTGERESYLNRNRERMLAWESQYESCALCGIKREEIKTQKQLGINLRSGNHRFNRDHILAKSRGGKPDQVRVLCWFCNYARSAMPTQLDYLVAAAGRAFWDAAKRLPPEIMLQQGDFQWNFQDRRAVVPQVETKSESSIKDGVN